MTGDAIPFAVTEVRISGTRNGNFLAYAAVTVSDSLVLRDIRIIRHKDDGRPPRVMMPDRKLADSGWVEIYHPITRGARIAIESAVLAAYARHIGQVQDAATQR